MKALGLALVAAVFGSVGCLPDRLSDRALDETIAEASYGANCPAQLDCRLATACHGDASCEAACTSDSAAAVVERVENSMGCYQACAASLCATAKGAALAQCQRRCLTTRCASENLACSATKGEGAGACFDILGCIDACPDPSSGQASQCADGCLRTLSAGDYDLAAAFSICQSGAFAAGKNPGETCINELAACYAGGNTGALACRDAFACQESCVAGGGNGDTCLATCFPTLNAAAQGEYLAYLLCLGDNGDDIAACKAPLVDCANASGKGSCKTMFDAVQVCIKKKGANGTGSCIVETIHDG